MAPINKLPRNSDIQRPASSGSGNSSHSGDLSPAPASPLNSLFCSSPSPLLPLSVSLPPTLARPISIAASPSKAFPSSFVSSHASASSMMIENFTHSHVQNDARLPSCHGRPEEFSFALTPSASPASSPTSASVIPLLSSGTHVSAFGSSVHSHLSALTQYASLSSGNVHRHHPEYQNRDHGSILSQALSLNQQHEDNSMASSASESSSALGSGSHGTLGVHAGSSRQFGRVNRMVLDKDSDEYRRRRERNNEAVKKSRMKSKSRTMQTIEHANQLKRENELLETKIKILTKELNFLKDLFLAHSKTSALAVTAVTGGSSYHVNRMLDTLRMVAKSEERIMTND